MLSSEARLIARYFGGAVKAVSQAASNVTASSGAPSAPAVRQAAISMDASSISSSARHGGSGFHARAAPQASRTTTAFAASAFT
ncbi:hypothetical protein D9Q98_008010 [Chlorella vulgaris]|uniref:Uncharacterized protein n=1 Tax=Chlorella vulgaris TaxID=3077 RepID=A0A9D4TI19_CHLVU|nr:hypothetical protein D9Q98_008010 [Chlorella vulgaris]